MTTNLTQQSTSFGVAIWRALRGTTSIMFWLSALAIFTYFVALFQNNTIAVKLLIKGVPPTAILPAAVAGASVAIICFMVHMVLLYRPKQRLVEPFQATARRFDPVRGVRSAVEVIAMTPGEVKRTRQLFDRQIRKVHYQ